MKVSFSLWNHCETVLREELTFLVNVDMFSLFPCFNKVFSSNHVSFVCISFGICFQVTNDMQNVCFQNCIGIYWLWDNGDCSMGSTYTIKSILQTPPQLEQLHLKRLVTKSNCLPNSARVCQLKDSACCCVFVHNYLTWFFLHLYTMSSCPFISAVLHEVELIVQSSMTFAMQEHCTISRLHIFESMCPLLCEWWSWWFSWLMHVTA